MSQGDSRPNILFIMADDHGSQAHYGIRTKDYKLIYWYNEGLGEKGLKECELFDLKKIRWNYSTATMKMDMNQSSRI